MTLGKRKIEWPTFPPRQGHTVTPSCPTHFGTCVQSTRNARNSQMVAQMDHAELLKLQFSCCRDFLTTSSLFPGSCSPAQWIRLQALALQVTSGPCAFEAPSAEEAEARTLWYDDAFASARRKFERTRVTDPLRHFSVGDHGSSLAP